MNAKKNLIIILSILCLGCANAKSKTEQPNIILFYVDDLGWMDLTYQGAKFYETPEIDKIANSGLIFSQAYTAHPRCVPARYGLLTGKFPGRSKVPGGGGLKPEDVTIAEALKEGGYSTYFLGKWHQLYEEGENNMPENQGFDVNIAGGKAGSPTTYWYPYRKNAKATIAGQKGLKQYEIHGLEEGEEGEYLTDRLTNEAAKLIENHCKNNNNTPFFMMMSHYGVHTPFEAKPKLVNKYKQKLTTMEYDLPEYEKTTTGDTKMRQDFPVYAAMIESIDQSMGQLVATLEEVGIADNTVIIFTADNGGLSTRGNNRTLATSNYPLRYGKGWLYEGGIREAFIVKYPGVTKAGSKTDVVVNGTDIYPTILDIAKLSKRPNDHKDGESFYPVLEGNEFTRSKPIFWHSPLGRPARTGDRNSTAVRIGDYKLIDWYDEGIIELYNIVDDIKEENNLAEKMPEKATEMYQLIVDWRKTNNVVIKKAK